MSLITVIGSSNTDMIMQLDKIPFPGETLIGNQFSTAPGGKGANQAVALARSPLVQMRVCSLMGVTSYTAFISMSSLRICLPTCVYDP